MLLTLAQLAVKLHKNLPAAWRYATKHNWPWQINIVRGVVIDAPLGKAVEGEWEGFKTWHVENN